MTETEIHTILHWLEASDRIHNEDFDDPWFRETTLPEKLHLALTSQLQDVNESTRLLRELLAVVHGDGGHYTSLHGLERATNDAIDVVFSMHHKLRKGTPPADWATQSVECPNCHAATHLRKCDDCGKVCCDQCLDPASGDTWICGKCMYNALHPGEKS